MPSSKRNLYLHEHADSLTSFLTNCANVFSKCNTQESEIFYIFYFLIVHTNCRCRTVDCLTVPNVHSLVFLEVPSKKIKVIPLGSSARTIAELGWNTRLIRSNMIYLHYTVSLHLMTSDFTFTTSQGRCIPPSLIGTRAFSDRGPQSPKGVKIENNCLWKSLESHHYLVFHKLCQKLQQQ